MKKIFDFRGKDKKEYRHRDERDNYEEYDDYREDLEDDYPEDEEDYPEEEDGDYRDEDDYYRDEVDDYRDEEDDYHEDEEDYPEDEDDYPEEDDYLEEDDYPDDEDYPEDEDDDYDYPEDGRYVRDDRRRSARNRDDSAGSRILAFLAGTTMLERIAAVFAILLIAGGVATASLYASSSKSRQQLDSFNEVGADINPDSDVVVGQSGLMAVADAEKARAMAAEVVVEDVENTEVPEEKEEVVADDAEDVVIKMTLTSIKNDIKVKFINSKTGKLVANLPLEISVVNPDGSTVSYNDHDQDGIIYKKDMAAGVYKITPQKLPGGYENYNLDTGTQSLTVKDQVELKAVDVSNEVKKESQVNVAKEDTAVKNEVESKLADTVEWVESTKTAVGASSDGTYSYEEISKDYIPDPASSAMVGFRPFMMLGTTGAATDASSEATSEATTDSAESEKSSEAASNDSSSEADSSDKKEENSSSDSSSADNSNAENSSEDNSNKDNSSEKTTTDDKKESEKKETITISSSANIELEMWETSKIEASGATTPIKFSSDKTEVATVSEDGLITAVNEGTAKITLSSDKAENNPTVTVIVTKKTIKADIPTTMEEGKEFTINVGDVRGIKVESSDAKIISVNGMTLKAEKESANPVTITLSADGYKTLTFDIKVTAVTSKNMTKVPLSISKITLVEGLAFKVSSSDSKLTIKLATSDANVVTISDTTITANKAGDATITVSADGYQDNTISVHVESKNATLKDKEGRTVYVINSEGNYREATYNDYFTGAKFFVRKAATEYKYTGWQTIGGKTYFFDKNGSMVTGEQVIQGAKYSFGSDGALSSSSGVMGIDVSKWNGNIDWNAVKNSGISFVIIRCGYRGSSQGALIEDSKFRSNIQGAQNAGLKVGVYFFTQAINEVEAVEEASMVINLIKGYNISYPVYLDVEASNGRGDTINASQRTANIKAFCGTIQNAGYKAGVYANRNWFVEKMNVSQLTGYRIWLAQYASSVSYSASRYDMWQYTAKGKVTGISGSVDMNICY